jgi:hypothetical protein
MRDLREAPPSTGTPLPPDRIHTIRFWLGQSSTIGCAGRGSAFDFAQIVPPNLIANLLSVQVLYTPVELNGAVDVGKCVEL